jgi:DNA-binding IclR family transcriptional regulator
MSVYRSEKRAHRILCQLAVTDATFAELQALFDDKHCPRSKLYAILNALRADGLVAHDFLAYRLTAAGQEGLRDLEWGQAVCTNAAAPSVRVFGRAA